MTISTAALARDEAPFLWYWVAYDPAYETTAEYQLQDRAGCETYLPRAITPAGKIEPFFPFYMAIRAQFPRWSVIRGCVGVIDVLCGGLLCGPRDQPFGFTPDHIEAIRMLEDGDPVKVGNGRHEREIRPITLAGPRPKELPSFEPGEAVDIMDGAWIGHTGIFRSLRGRERAELLVQSTRVTVKRECLARADRENGRKGGQARAEALTPERRREIAKQAIHARWAKGGG